MTPARQVVGFADQLGRALAGLGAQAGGVAVVVSSSQTVEIAELWNYPAEVAATWRMVPLSADLPFSVAIREDRVVAVSTAIELGARFPGLAEVPIRGEGAWLSVPVHDGGVVVGTLGAIFHHSRGFGATYLETAQRAADELGPHLAAEQKRRTRAAGRFEISTRSALARLQAMIAALTGTATVTSVSDVVVANAVEALAASAAGVSLRQAESVIVVSSQGYPPELIDANREQPLSADMPSPTVIRSGEPLFMESAADWADQFPTVHDTARFVADTATAVVPLAGHAEVLGALALTFPAPRVFSADERSLLRALGQQAGQAIERALLLEREHDGRLAAESAARRAELISDLLARLAASESIDETADIATGFVTTQIGAAGTVIALASDAGELRVVAQRGFSAPLARRMPRIPLTSNLPVAVAARTNAPVWDAPMQTFDEHPGPAEELRRRGRGSVCALPLRHNDTSIGAIGVDFHDAKSVDRDLLIAVSRAVSLGTERASRFETDHQIAEQMQHAFLPPSLPSIPGVEIAVRYETAESATEIGGDWYDAFLLPSGRLGLSIGDVVGHDLHAARSMGRLRHALRAYAMLEEPPAQVCGRLDAHSHHLGVEGFATLIYAIIDPERHTLAYCRCGHPPALLVTTQDSGYLEAVGNQPIGLIGPHPPVQGETIDLPGSYTLVLYTDGLVERRITPLDTNLAILKTTASQPLPAEQLADTIMEALKPGGGRDDTALLILQDTRPSARSPLQKRAGAPLVPA